MNGGSALDRTLHLPETGPPPSLFPCEETWCVNMAAAGQNPCTSNRPNGSCAAYGGDFGCMSASAYCQGGVRYACPPNTMCASKGPCSIRI